MSEEKFAALILAAGRSTRMGAFKPLMPLGGQMNSMIRACSPPFKPV
jgi:CTP:molybdopterin cytidylyltransferase MocA